MDYDLILKDAKIVTASDQYIADIGIINGKIAAISQELSADSATSVIDVKQAMVTPGGIDTHCHLSQPSADGSVLADDFFTGSRSALCGGTTTVVPFALQAKGQSLKEAVETYHKEADGQSCIDYGFHILITDVNKDTLKELPVLTEQGYTSFKIYMTYESMKLSDRNILDVMDQARNLGAITMVHAENDDCISWLTDRLKEQGKTSPRFHCAAHTTIGEREATHRAISLSELVDVPILLVHVSSREAIEQIHWGRGNGLNIFSETCPQYLFLTAEDLGIDDHFHGAKCVCSPPPRDKESQEAVWAALANGTFSVFSSDHCPYNYDETGKLIHGEGASFDKIPNGIAGLETRLPLLMSEGVLKQRISPERFVELTSTTPAKLYGLYPQKGTIAIGSDADLVIWDTQNEKVIRNNDLHSEADHTPYEGKSIRAWPEITISKGEIVYKAGQFLGEKGKGTFLRCALPFPPQVK
ncbi:dihydropyrimidinase [Vibrio sp.]|nr:dihydropyrimidinase [Vibrio sp.]